MSPTTTVSGARVGEDLTIAIELTEAECVPGDKWRLSATDLTLAPAAAQEIPTRATSHIMTWKSAIPLQAAWLNKLVTVMLYKEHGTNASLTPVWTFNVAIQPAAPATSTPAATTATPPANPVAAATAMPQPLQIQIVGAPSVPNSAARWINGVGVMGWLGGFVILLIVLAFLWVVLYVMSPAAINGLSAPPAVPAE